MRQRTSVLEAQIFVILFAFAWYTTRDYVFQHYPRLVHQLRTPINPNQKTVEHVATRLSWSLEPAARLLGDHLKKQGVVVSSPFVHSIEPPRFAIAFIEDWSYPSGVDWDRVSNTLLINDSRDLTSWMDFYIQPALEKQLSEEDGFLSPIVDLPDTSTTSCHQLWSDRPFLFVASTLVQDMAYQAERTLIESASWLPFYRSFTDAEDFDDLITTFQVVKNCR